MVSANYKKYKRIIRWPDLKMVREKGPHHKWHVDEPSLSCLRGSRVSVISGQHKIFKIWISQSLEKNNLYMLGSSGDEINPAEICDTCAGKVMRLLRWCSSDEGNLEIEQQEMRDELEEREFRAKGLTE
jgi:hypothetical protein